MPALLLVPSAQRDLNPLTVLIDERARLLDRKPARETWIALQEPVNGRVIAGGHLPFSILTNQILLDYQLAVAVEGLGDMSEHGCINDREVSRNTHGADFYSLELIKISCPLQALDQPLAREARARRSRQGIIQRFVLTVFQLVKDVLNGRAHF